MKKYCHLTGDVKVDPLYNYTRLLPSTQPTVYSCEASRSVVKHYPTSVQHPTPVVALLGCFPLLSSWHHDATMQQLTGAWAWTPRCGSGTRRGCRSGCEWPRVHGWSGSQVIVDRQSSLSLFTEYIGGIYYLMCTGR